MGKSAVSCFKFIACGSDSVDHHDLPTPESKDQSDQRGWSFRKRSPRQRVLSSTATPEAPSSANKESTGTSVINFPVQPDSNVPEKTLLANGTKDKSEFPLQLDSKLPDNVSTKEDEWGDATHDESSVFMIQSAIRGFLARQVLLKQKKIIKLQAVVRGHIIRSYARGTLHCICAIVKMQALVRSRQANYDSAILANENAKHSGAYTYVSIEKLLSNAFARQLMESTPRPTNIKCEPSKSDTAWKWLERWMAVSSVTTEESVESRLPAEHREENIEHCDDNRSISIPSECCAEPADSGSGSAVSTEVVPKNDWSLITNDTNNSDVNATLHSADQPNLSFDATESDHIEIKETDLAEETEEKSLPKEEINERSGPDMENISLEKEETGARKVSRKVSNPFFIAAQSKFEELSSGVAPLKKLPSPSIHDPTVESRNDVLENSIFSNASAVQIGDSECGTQLSISSTLDSPERSESAVNETTFSAGANHHRSTESFDLESSGMSMIPEADQLSTNSTKVEKEDENINPGSTECLNSTVADTPQPETKPETEASPRSQVTVPESLATPTSQVSVKPKKSKGEKTGLTRKNKSSSADKLSLPNHSQDAGLRSSLDEHVAEHNTRKKQHSIGSERPEHEPSNTDNNNSSSNSLPSYMQVTESARAKAIANGSPRSSPDVLDKDIYIKKRHSLPSSNDRQRSPRIQRPQPNGKSNLTHSPQERKWRR